MPKRKGPTGGTGKVPNSKPDAAPAPRARTKTDQDAIYMQVTRAQAEVIRAKAERENKSIKDVLLTGLMERSELEADIAHLRRDLAEANERYRVCMESATGRMKDVQAMLLGASTERALTKEEAQIFMVANKFLLG